MVQNELNELTDEELRKQLVEDLVFLNGMAAACMDRKSRAIFFYGTTRVRTYLEGNLSAEQDKGLAEELMRSYS